MDIYPKVSIISPSFNQVPFIEETICSVLNQTYPNIEYIIIDGCSTDGSVDIIRKYEKSISYWVSEKDEGQADAINKGLSVATGSILAYLNTDDTYLPSTVETVVSFFIENPNVFMVYGDIFRIDEQSQIRKRINPNNIDYHKLVSGQFYLPQPTVFFRKEVWENIGYFDKNLNLAMDLDYWIRVYLNQYKIAYINEVLAKERIYPNAKSSLLKHKYINEKLEILSKLFSNNLTPIEIIRRKKQLYGEVYIDGAVLYTKKFCFKEALKCFCIAFLLYPKCYFSLLSATYRKIKPNRLSQK